MATQHKGGINGFNDDILQNILTRLGALPFANATCVSKTWYRLCSQILSRPKLASALSQNPSLTAAVAEVLVKVLSKPIRPHFAIAIVSEQHGLKLAHLLLTRTLGPRIPLVTHVANGAMGMDALTDELREVKWDFFDYSGGLHPREFPIMTDFNRGIVLVVGYVPGLKVDAMPLIHPKNNPELPVVDKFVRDIKVHTAHISGSESPAAIMMFGDDRSEMNSVVAKLDYTMAKETVMVGDAGGCFLFNSLNYTIPYPEHSYTLDAVALVFARDKDKAENVGEIEFHVMMAGGLIPFGPRFETISVGVKPSGGRSWICAKLEEYNLILNYRAVEETIHETVTDLSPRCYIAVSQRRRHYRTECINMATSIAFFQVLGGIAHHFAVDGVGIRPGDSFTFYHSDLETAQTTRAIAFDNLEIVKENTASEEDDGEAMETVFGGLVFSCRSRGESYFGEPNSETSPFRANFPGVPVAGVFCKGEIGRGSSSFIQENEFQQQCPPNSCLHASSAVYLAMSYTPPQPINQSM